MQPDFSPDDELRPVGEPDSGDARDHEHDGDEKDLQRGPAHAPYTPFRLLRLSRDAPIGVPGPWRRGLWPVGESFTGEARDEQRDGDEKDVDRSPAHAGRTSF